MQSTVDPDECDLSPSIIVWEPIEALEQGPRRRRDHPTRNRRITDVDEEDVERGLRGPDHVLGGCREVHNGMGELRALVPVRRLVRLRVPIERLGDLVRQPTDAAPPPLPALNEGHVRVDVHPAPPAPRNARVGAHGDGLLLLHGAVGRDDEREGHLALLEQGLVRRDRVERAALVARVCVPQRVLREGRVRRQVDRRHLEQGQLDRVEREPDQVHAPRRCGPSHSWHTTSQAHRTKLAGELVRPAVRGRGSARVRGRWRATVGRCSSSRIAILRAIATRVARVRRRKELRLLVLLLLLVRLVRSAVLRSLAPRGVPARDVRCRVRRVLSPAAPHHRRRCSLRLCLRSLAQLWRSRVGERLLLQRRRAIRPCEVRRPHRHRRRRGGVPVDGRARRAHIERRLRTELALLRLMRISRSEGGGVGHGRCRAWC